MEQTVEYRNNLVILQESRFFSFLHKFHGFDLAVALEFTQNFDGSQAKVGSLEFAITKESISHNTGLATVGEQWSKKEKIEKKLWCRFMVNPKQKVD